MPSPQAVSAALSALGREAVEAVASTEDMTCGHRCVRQDRVVSDPVVVGLGGQHSQRVSGGHRPSAECVLAAAR